MDEQNEHTKKLAAARAELVSDRRNLAEALAQPYKRGHTENMRSSFVATQAAIEAVDRALIDEQAMAGKSKPPIYPGPIIVSDPRNPEIS